MSPGQEGGRAGRKLELGQAFRAGKGAWGAFGGGRLEGDEQGILTIILALPFSPPSFP